MQHIPYILSNFIWKFKKYTLNLHSESKQSFYLKIFTCRNSQKSPTAKVRLFYLIEN